MINRRVSAAFLLRDGFTGRPLAEPSATRCLLDGRPLKRPVWKRYGYLVLTDLEPGEHELLISRYGYRDELVKMNISDDSVLEDSVSLKPGTGYRFPPETVRVALSLRSSGSASSGVQLWLGVKPRTRLVIAQESAEAGEEHARLFCEGSAALLPIPGHFLIADRTAPELVYLRSLRDEECAFSAPLANKHERGTELIPVQSYTADSEGAVQVLLPEPGTLVGFFGGRLFCEVLDSGAQALNWDAEV